MDFDQWFARAFPELHPENDFGNLSPSLKNYIRNVALSAWKESQKNTIELLKITGRIS